MLRLISISYARTFFICHHSTLMCLLPPYPILPALTIQYLSGFNNQPPSSSISRQPSSLTLYLLCSHELPGTLSFPPTSSSSNPAVLWSPSLNLSNHARSPSLAVCNSLITFWTIFNMFCVWLLLSSMQHLSAKFRTSFFLYAFGLCLTIPRWQSIYSAKLLLAVICKYRTVALSEKILYDNFPLFQESL